MKLLKSLGVMVLFFTMHTLSAQSLSEKWPAIKEFHGVMSTTFHPAEEGNLEPIKTRSLEMVEKANALDVTTMPKEFSNDKIKDAVARLQKGAKELHQLVTEKVKDEVLVEKLTSLHDVFHEIVGLCKNENH